MVELNTEHLKDRTDRIDNFDEAFADDLNVINNTLESIQIYSSPNNKYKEFLIHEFGKIYLCNGSIIITIDESSFKLSYIIKELNIQNFLSDDDYLKVIKYDFRIRNSIVQIINKVIVMLGKELDDTISKNRVLLDDTGVKIDSSKILYGGNIK